MAYVERLIGILRRDCLDHILIFSEQHLRQVLTSYSVNYNEMRPHLGLGKDAPLGRAVERSGTFVDLAMLQAAGTGHPPMNEILATNGEA